MFLSKAVFRKCLSASKAPFKSDSKCVYPTAQQIESPTALHNEKRPPTQSSIGKIFAEAIPNATAFSIFDETATKCVAIFSGTAAFKNHSLTTSALARVS